MNKIENYCEFIKDVFNRYYPIEENSLSQLYAIAKVRQLQKGELLLNVGQTSKHIYILNQGVIVSFFISNEGNQYHKNIFLEGDFVGSTVSALKHESSHFGLEVIEDTTIISFDYKKYRKLIENHSDLKNFYIAYLEKNWIINKEKREIEIVMKDASERYLDFIRFQPNIEKRVPLHYIASHLGITPTQLSRIRKKIKKKFPNQHM
ncbi:cyclic nucleotide-binding protein [Aquimarina atlantica]|uniref:Cyclic nucleotide-binding protein n=1 Tax=Aquimarina atlantica TaxID=1317122 RepID=A0A023BRB4_9FLAO|nr:Crp/Fnr family transcriptional regulator [Aquimarina atlantica]EZH72348.1 cyclic nucleotide-binding protein [Aquimarina atlantica]